MKATTGSPRILNVAWTSFAEAEDAVLTLFFFIYIFHLYTLSRVVSGGVTHLYKVVVQNKLGHRKRKTHLYNVVDQHKLGWEKRLQISQTLGIKCAEFADYSWIIPPSISWPNYPLEK